MFSKNVTLSASLVAGLFMLNVLFMIFGTYLYIPNLDDFLHFSGGTFMAFFIFSCVSQFLVKGKKKSDFIVKLLLSFSLTVAVAVSWEFLEFTADALLGMGLQEGLTDTLTDLLVGSTGGLFFTLMQFFRSSKK